MGPRKLVRHMQNLSYTYDTYSICMGLGPSILSVIDKNPSYSGPSYPSSPVAVKKYFRKFVEKLNCLTVILFHFFPAILIILGQIRCMLQFSI